jgi:hypothetical protein
MSLPLPNKHFGMVLWRPEQSSTLANGRSGVRLAIGTNASNTIRYYVDWSAGKMRFVKDNGTQYLCETPVNAISFNVADNVFVAWMDNPTSGYMYLWVGVNNGTLQKYSLANTQAVTDVQKWFIGCSSVSGFEANGVIDFPVISDTIPTDEQVEALYRAAEIGGNRHFPVPSIPMSAKGAASGVAPLDTNSNVPLANLGNVPIVKEAYLPLWVADNAQVTSTSTQAGSGMVTKSTASVGVKSVNYSPQQLLTLGSGWSASQKFALQASMSTSNTSATASAQLYDYTADALVAGTLMTTVMDTTITVRSAQVTLIPGHIYGVALWTNNVSYAAKLSDAYLVAIS